MKRAAANARAAIVGAGPAGFYAADQLLAAGFDVDLYDALPTPFGLVRAGVAPDHPKIKRVTRVYARIAERPGVRFFGGVVLGEHVTREDLLSRYHAVIYAVGMATDRRLGIPGEDRPGSHAATEFVGWYNGHPDHADRAFDLRCGRAVVIGNGNVAIDVARMLVLEPQQLAATDTADHALDALRAAGVREVVLLGRRGPAEASFTHPELRELGDLPDVDVIVDPEQVESIDEPGDVARRRVVALLREYAHRPSAGASRRIEFRFLRTPLELLGRGDDAPVTGVRVAINALEPAPDGRPRAVPTGREEVIECGLVLRSIGYRGEPLAGVPFDDRRGVIRNVGGRVCAADGSVCRGEYAVGWIKRGPSGVIGTNKRDASETVQRVVEDRDAGRLAAPAAEHGEIDRWLRERVPHVVAWNGWEAIDRHETRLGEDRGRPRVKLVQLGEMLDIAARTIEARRGSGPWAR